MDSSYLRRVSVQNNVNKQFTKLFLYVPKIIRSLCAAYKLYKRKKVLNLTKDSTPERSSTRKMGGKSQIFPLIVTNIQMVLPLIYKQVWDLMMQRLHH